MTPTRRSRDVLVAWLVPAVPFLWLAGLFLLPLLIVLKISLSDAATAHVFLTYRCIQHTTGSGLRSMPAID